VGIVEEDIARVRAATDFVAVASEQIALRRVGAQWSGLCPFHVEKSPSFSINPQLGLYYCFGCGARGDVITFVRELHQLDFREAVETLAARAGIALRYDDSAGSEEHRRRSRVHETLEAAVEWYHQRLLSAPDAAPARRYLRVERGYDGELVRRYRLGWAPEGREVLRRALGLPVGALVDAGLAQRDEHGSSRDFFRGRLLFPIFDPSGKPIGAGGRSLPGGRPPKYKNTPATAVYDKSSVLYGLNWAKRKAAASDRIVVCEGYTDVIGLHQAGVEEAVAACGTALADGHVRALTRFARTVVLAYDADGAGQAAAERVYGWERRFEVDVRVAALPAGQDPADLARSDPEGLAAAIDGARPFLEFQLERHFARADLDSAEGRVRAATAAVAAVRAHPDPLVQDQYLMAVADRCRVPAEQLRSLPVGPAGEGGLGGADGRGRPRSRGPAPPSSPPSSDDSFGRAGVDLPGRGVGRPSRFGPGGAGNGASRPPGGAGPAGATRPAPGTAREGDDRAAAPALGPPPLAELAALRLAVHRPELVADRLAGVLFADARSRAAFDALVGAAELHEALAAADPEVAALLSRLGVETCEEEPDDVMVRLLERAANRTLRELTLEMRAAPPDEQGAYAASISWLKQAAEALRPAEADPDGPRGGPEATRTVEARLVAWLEERRALCEGRA